jgi:hypothetical protein
MQQDLRWRFEALSDINIVMQNRAAVIRATELQPSPEPPTMIGAESQATDQNLALQNLPADLWQRL